ncbi:MAG: hypothetical protein SVR81_09770 [Chloroflexota bacterium]|nr:hypothetical protein [Chloroflexota bacterium]
MQEPSSMAWLAQSEVPLPAEIPPGRYPAPEEIRAVLEAIPRIRTIYRETPAVWQVSITSRRDVSWASLTVRQYQGDPTLPQPFYFDGGWDEIILMVTSHLAKRCGPLVLLHDSGAAPQVVM